MVAPSQVIETVLTTFRDAAQANRRISSRRGNVIYLDADCGNEVMVTADLHGNRLNFENLLAAADLPAHPGRHLVMQEVCHGGPSYPGESGCMSHLLLEDMARLKVEFPERFHFLLSNHEWAEIADYPITKASRLLNLSFRCGMREMYGAATDEVREAYLEFLITCPLAICVADAIWICHSAPEEVDQRGFDTSVLERPLEARDFQPQSDLFRLLWGRDFRDANAAAFAQLIAAKLLIHGHEPCRQGYHVPNRHQLILDCCGATANYVLLPTDRALSQQEVLAQVRSIG